ncbi:MAG TPA: VWA domain-containing protein [Anaerolineaceae bacterium]
MDETGTISLHLTCTPGVSAIRPTNSPRLVYYLIDIECAGAKPRVPGYVVLLIDCSESMRIRLVTPEQFRLLAGTGSLVEVMTDGVPAWQVKNISPEMMARLQSRMDFVIEAMNQFGEQLSAQDYYSVVGFGGKAVLLAADTPGSDRQPLQQVIGQLAAISLGDETFLADGLRLALEQVHRRNHAGLAHRIVLLTDGFTGDVARCYALADQARKAHIPVTTMGVGAEFNEGLLIPLADRTGGRAYYIDQLETLPKIFAQEARAALSVLFRNLDLHIQPAPGVSLRRMARVSPEMGRLDLSPNGDGVYGAYLGDYPQGGHIELLLELVIDAPLRLGEQSLAELALGFEDPQHQGTQSLQARAEVIVAQGIDEQVSEPVARAVQKVTAFQVGSRVLEEARNLPPGEAAGRLQQAAVRLAELGEQGLAEQMARQAEDLLRLGKMDARATKRLIYETRRITEPLK